MTHYLLDTCSVSDALRGEAPKLVSRMAGLPRERFGVSVITEMELRFGLAKLPTGHRYRPIVEEFVRTVDVLPLPPTIARVYGDVRAELGRRGQPIGPLDTIIASHALAIDATLVTSNVREFRRVKGLRVENWAR